MYKDLEYKKLANEVSKKYNWNLDEIYGSIVFWIPWADTGTFSSLEDAKKNSIDIDEKNKVLWCYSLDDLKELISGKKKEDFYERFNVYKKTMDN